MQVFSATQNLREIKFGNFWVYETAIILFFFLAQNLEIVLKFPSLSNVGFSDLLKLPNLISRRIWVAVKFSNFHTASKLFSTYQVRSPNHFDSDFLLCWFSFQLNQDHLVQNYFSFSKIWFYWLGLTFCFSISSLIRHHC